MSEELIGHHRQREVLERDLSQKNLAHAYLFEGPARVGKFTVAKWFGTEILLSDVAPDQREKTEHQIKRLIHPDFLVLDRLWIEDESDDWDELSKFSNVPQEHRAKAEMKTDTIGIEDIRTLQDRLYATGSGHYRICLIRSVERMQDEASNALLKILEEPPPGRIFILTTQSASALLPTIVSRCRSVRFHRLSHKELLPLLADVDESDRGFLLHLSQGSPGVLVALRDNPELLREEKQLHDQALAFWTASSLTARLSVLDPLHKRGEASDRFLLHLSLALRECHPSLRSPWGSALLALNRALQTNANRALLTQQFALSVADSTLSSAAVFR